MHLPYRDLMVLSWDAPIRQELDMVEQEMRKSVFSEQKVLTEISLYVIGSGGKRIRPAIAILSFRANGGTDPAKVIKIASAFEMIHAATLIHDDINDSGEFRRGREAAYKRFGTQKALIAGDFLFVRSFRLGGSFDETIIEMVADACTAIAESEMLQSQHELDAETSMQDYIKIIEGKTARPIEIGARIGAYMAKKDQAVIDSMGVYGMNIGIAFQIIDDILDVTGDRSTLGKPRGVDFMDGKPNLVLLKAMSDNTHGTKVRELFVKKEKTRKDLDDVIALVNMTNAVTEAKSLAISYTDKALESLRDIPETSYKDSMRQLAQIMVERNS
jgi:octaprenyl-diphosphate synthase